MSAQQYTYYAFISYKHEDRKWAGWLQHRLQSYRLPVRTRKQHRELPKRLSPVFYDKNLRPGLLRDRIRDEIQSSRFLIVVCSRSAQAGPEWLNEEIGFFLEGGGTRDRIIPVIVDKTDHPVQETFPSRLAELNAEETILGVSLPADGKKQTVLKLVSCMQGIRIEELESEDSRRRKKKALLASAAGLLALSLAAYAGYSYWDYYVPKTGYYLDYAERLGVPEGIGRLTEEEAASMAAHYTIVTCRHRVQELRHEDACGRLVDDTSWTYPARPARAVYTYVQESGSVNTVTHYSEDDHPVLVLDYDDNLKGVSLQSADRERYTGGGFLEAHTFTLFGSSSEREFRNNTSISRYLLDYDENGFVSELRYAADPVYNTVAQDADGIGGFRYERDALGRAVRTSFLTYTGDEALPSAAYADRYDVVGTQRGLCGLFCAYDERNDLTSVVFFGAEGRPVFPRNGEPACIEYEYDEHHNLTEARAYDPDHAPFRYSYGHTALRYQYDENGNTIRLDYTDADGNPVVTDNGYSACAVYYDENGRMTSTVYLGPDGSPVMTAGGYASMIYLYDEEGYDSGGIFYDEKGEPVLLPGGYAGSRLKKDEHGNLVEQVFIGTDGQPVLCDKGYAYYTCRYENDLPVEETYLDTDRRPVLLASGYASTRMEYDSRGNCTCFRLLGLSGEPVTGPDGYSFRRFFYDEQGRKIQENYYGTDGSLFLLDGLVAIVRHEFDTAGRIIRSSYYGTEDQPVPGPEGDAYVTMEYDANGNLVTLRYFGPDGNPCVNVYGYVFCKKEYDLRGNETGAAYYDADGNLVMTTSGFAAKAMTYDEYGKETSMTLYDTDGKPISAGGSEDGADSRNVMYVRILLPGTDPDQVDIMHCAVLVRLGPWEYRNYDAGASGDMIQGLTGIPDDVMNQPMEMQYLVYDPDSGIFLLYRDTFVRSEWNLVLDPGLTSTTGHVFILACLNQEPVEKRVEDALGEILP